MVGVALEERHDEHEALERLKLNDGCKRTICNHVPFTVCRSRRRRQTRASRREDASNRVHDDRSTAPGVSPVPEYWISIDAIVQPCHEALLRLFGVCRQEK